ncbi:permease-like cell division protein FtsX [Acidipropionibacterium jensenii]|uniref:Cell division protein FtsX n=2 Tax=Acidipropionibacterium jensenii TaxID=1749 RepID=A0A3S4WW85_9ACTN|nr:permease-like cell division protein FtsX [Acidipropionibacterium jensenii]MDN5977389.1 permease-like cell division protein FtsX [Acidipropionibacterium jensenii]MDN5996409.1 permease-like cell division protein FtsX [Acidipropionibacterium jensenii]MDN6021630.1 permease-like cell division protein FtsX [Acidipropionibacterium jensenii]MDN6426656.1 permease-like cell division protein FtsX [Acidipropionibacterium jensenii]MDN6442183.1 permease-like cell division protein FtsX [Acidipropionibacte
MRHTLRETWTGLRRNLTMTVAVIVTMWVSLSLFGAALLATQQVDLVKGKWYDKIEVSVFLCVPNVDGGQCTSGQGATQAQKDAIRQALEANPQVEKVYYESKHEAYQEYQRVYKDSPVKDVLTEATIQDSFRVKLKDPQQYEGVVTQAKGLPGVQAVLDLHPVLDPLFLWLNALKWGTLGMSVLLLVAAALQIGNTIRMAAFSRRRELGIMRLVGASNAYILTPFLLESLVAGLIGGILASGSLALGVYFIIIKKAAASITTIVWIGWHQALLAMGAVLVVSILLSVLPAFVATRKYLKV